MAQIQWTEKIQLKSRGQVKFWKLKVSTCFASASTTRQSWEFGLSNTIKSRAISLAKCMQSNWEKKSIPLLPALCQLTKPLEKAPSLLFLVLPQLLFLSHSSAAEQPAMAACPGAVTGNLHFPSDHQSTTSCSRVSKSFHTGTWEKALLQGWYRELK